MTIYWANYKPQRKIRAQKDAPETKTKNQKLVLSCINLETRDEAGSFDYERIPE